MKARSFDAQQILVLECTREGKRGQLRMLSRKDLLDEIRAVAAAGTPAGALLTSRDVRKVDPYFAARLEPVIIVRAGCITVSLGRTELRAIITHERLYFVVPDGADSILTLVQSNLALLLAGEASGSPAREETSERADNDEAVTADAADGADVDAHSVPFELAALEAVLMTACTALHQQQSQLTERVSNSLHALRRTVIGSRVVAGDQQLENVRQLKQEVRHSHATPPLAVSEPRRGGDPCPACLEIPSCGRRLACYPVSGRCASCCCSRRHWSGRYSACWTKMRTWKLCS